MARLTNLQKEFINQYFVCGRNATEAVIQAGYSVSEPDTVSGRATAAAIGYENLRKPHIRAKIDERLEEYAMPANEVIARLSDHAYGNLTMVLDADGTPSLEKAKLHGVTHLIKEWTSKTTVISNGRNKDSETIITEHSVKLYDAQSALVQLGRYHKLFTDKVEMVTWEDEALRDIRSGLVSYADVSENLGDELAQQLFQKAGVTYVAG